MTVPSQSALRNRLLLLQEQLPVMGRTYGKNSPEYQNMLRQLTQTWFMLKMSRRSTEFFEEVTR